MKLTIFAGLLGALLVAGCVSTVSDNKTAAVPLVKDKVSGHYQRSVDQVFQAAKEVISFNGTIARESTIFGQANTVKTVQGKVNQRSVWVRVEGVEPNLTAVTVQVRTSGGGADQALGHELEKQIAVKLAEGR
jgi:hypothetical protein